MVSHLVFLADRLLSILGPLHIRLWNGFNVLYIIQVGKGYKQTLRRVLNLQVVSVD